MVNWPTAFHIIVETLNDILLYGGLFFSGAAFGGEFYALRNEDNRSSPRAFRLVAWPVIMFFIWFMIIPPIVWTAIKKSRNNQGS